MASRLFGKPLRDAMCGRLRAVPVGGGHRQLSSAAAAAGAGAGAGAAAAASKPPSPSSKKVLR